jgi:hypothetical protein
MKNVEKLYSLISLEAAINENTTTSSSSAAAAFQKIMW